MLVLRRWLIALLTLIGLGIGLAVTLIQAPLYASSTTVFVSADNATKPSKQESEFAAQRVESYAELLEGDVIADRVVKRLNLNESARDLAAHIDAAAEPKTVILRITVSDVSASHAQLLADAVAKEFVAFVGELDAADNATPVKATIVDAANKPSAPSSPNLWLNVGIGVGAGLLIGLFVAWLKERLDTTIRSAGTLEDITGAPLLGAILFEDDAIDEPTIRELDPYDPRAEAYRVIRTGLQFKNPHAEHEVFVVTSAMPGEGKTATAINLGLILAEGGESVALIEADLRKPAVAEYLGLEKAVGVTTVLIGRTTLDQALQEVGALDILTSGRRPPNPAELVKSAAMQELIATLRERYRYLIIDAPPLLPVTDASLLTASADGAILVARYGDTNESELATAVKRIETVNGTIVGTVLNMAPHSDADGYGYGYGYGYGTQPGADEGARPERPERVHKPAKAPKPPKEPKAPKPPQSRNAERRQAKREAKRLAAEALAAQEAYAAEQEPKFTIPPLQEASSDPLLIEPVLTEPEPVPDPIGQWYAARVAASLPKEPEPAPEPEPEPRADSESERSDENGSVTEPATPRETLETTAEEVEAAAVEDESIVADELEEAAEAAEPAGDDTPAEEAPDEPATVAEAEAEDEAAEDALIEPDTVLAEPALAEGAPELEQPEEDDVPAPEAKEESVAGEESVAAAQSEPADEGGVVPPPHDRDAPTPRPRRGSASRPAGPPNSARQQPQQPRAVPPIFPGAMTAGELARLAAAEEEAQADAPGDFDTTPQPPDSAASQEKPIAPAVSPPAEDLDPRSVQGGSGPRPSEAPKFRPKLDPVLAELAAMIDAATSAHPTEPKAEADAAEGAAEGAADEGDEPSDEN